MRLNIQHDLKINKPSYLFCRCQTRWSALLPLLIIVETVQGLELFIQLVK